MAILKSTQARAGHAAGIFSDMTLDGPEIGTLVAVIDRAKNLPNRKTIGKQDPYCAMRLGKEAKKTDTDRRGGQTPKWDQELRFTVHDSPDYYKLKCSVFNDDKRTDLIGEAWVDLTEVIKLGGGQSDVWQQLSFKGKYAGEIRIELTFYDAREKPLPQEKKKPKEKQEDSPSGSTSDLSLSGPRSLGPRDIKRRPLPASPAAPASVQSSSVIIEHSKPERPPKIPLEANTQQYQQRQQPPVVHAPVALRPRGSSTSPQPQQQSQFLLQDSSDQYLSEEQSMQQTQYQQRQITQTSYADQYQEEQSWQEEDEQQHYPEGRQYHDHNRMPSHLGQNYYRDSGEQQIIQSQSVYPDEDELWRNQRPQSIHTHSAPITPHNSSPAHRPSPTTNNSDSQIVRYHQQQRQDASSSRQIHADSPLRQSVSHHELDMPLASQSSVPPPLPPKHRDTPPRRPRSEYPPSAYIPQPLRTSGNRSSVVDRSPLQSLEDEYLGHRQERLTDAHTPQRHSISEPPQDPYYETPQRYEPHEGQQIEHYGRRRTYDELPQSQPQQQPQRPSAHRRRSSYEIKHRSFDQQMVEEPQAITHHDPYHSGQDDGYQPFVEDAPPSPGLQPAVARKAVGAQPKKLNGVPFGPDAYDVLNPASSPVTNERTRFQTAEQAKEAERLREVEKIRDLGPIIGNDGRVIDPSDHLPSDTWAPEPERKNRKPEHVIHIRSKNDPKRPSGARASPLVIKHTGPQSVQSSPAPEPASSPAARTTPSNFIGGRNRLQKSTPTPARTLPNQPYSSPAGHIASSPALATPPQNIYEDHRPTHDRRPSYESRLPSHLTRPPLSEYQVPVGNSYTPRTGSYNSSPMKMIEPAYETPTKQQSYQTYSSPAPDNYQRRNSYDNRGNSYNSRRNSYDDRSDSYDRRNSGYAYDDAYSQRPSPAQPQQVQHYDDPLAAEMSLIDIGPSRPRQSQGYHSGALVKSRGRW